MNSTALALTLASFGVVLIAISYQRHRTHRDRSAILHGVSGAVLFMSGALLLALALNFNTYTQLRNGEPLAELSIEKSAANSFQVRLLRIRAGDLQVFTLQGERWQMEAKLLQWHGWANWLGLSSNIRLEALRSISRHNNNSVTFDSYANSYSLNSNPGIDLSAWQGQYPQLFSVLSTRSLNTNSLPLQNGLRYHLYFQDGEIMARQINMPIKPTASSNTAGSVAQPEFVNEFNRQKQESSASESPSAAVIDSSSSSRSE
jgi:hypothetical protein